MRGKGFVCIVQNALRGITPAYAGKSKAGFRSYGKGEDHPRLCGEKGNKFLFEKFAQGSPPPMRGKGCSLRLRPPQAGITPAYAGKRDQTAVIFLC